MIKLTSYLRAIMLFTFLTGVSCLLRAQVISTATTVELSNPVERSFVVTGALNKKVVMELSTTSVYANFIIEANGKTVLDNIDLPSAGTHQLNALVRFETTGNVQLKFLAQGGDIEIKKLDFEEIANIDYPFFQDITEQSGLTTERSLKYGGPSIADVDNDGDYDFVLNNHNDAPGKLFWNDGDGTVSIYDKNLNQWKRQDLHGSAAGDYDNDGDLDLLLSLGGGNGTNPKPPVFYKNDNGNFVLSTTDVGITSGSRGRSPRWVDFDLDGDLDLALINAHGINGNNGAQHIFYSNKGDGTFELKPIAGLENAGGERIVVTDLDNDNIDDLVLFSPLSVWKGNGDFTFQNMTSTWLPSSAFNLQNITAAVDVDIDNDGDMDLYLTRGKPYFQLANKALDFDPVAQRFDIRDEGNSGITPMDFEAGDSILFTEFESVFRGYEDGFPIFLGSNKTPNVIDDITDTLLITRSTADGWPSDRSANGLYIGYEGSGKWKLESVRNANIYWSIHWTINGVTSVTTQWSPNNRNLQDMLLRNDNGSFVDVSKEWNIPRGGNHWGVTAGDFNNDSHQDLFIYRFGYLKSRVSDYILMNTGSGNFEITTSHTANDAGTNSHGDMGQAFDFDLDGDVDLLNGSDEYGEWHLYTNDKADNGNYALVKVGYAPQSNVDPISALVTVKTANNEYVERIGSSGASHSQSLLNIVHFGLGQEDSIESITVRWRDGETVEMTKQAANKMFDTDKVDPTSLEISPATTDLRVGTTITLKASIEPDNANKNLIWTSGDESVATVDQDGIVTATGDVGETVTITAKSEAGNVSATSTIKIVSLFEIKVESVTISSESAEVIEGDTLKLEAVVLPELADNPEVMWSSSDELKAKVADDGEVAAVAEGTVTITATSVENNAIKDDFEITVLPLIPASVAFDDPAIYTSTQYETGGKLKVSADYHAGTGNTVIASDQGGVKFWFRHLTKDWGVVNDKIEIDASALGQESGTASAEFLLTDLVPTTALENGDFYYLFVSFVSSNGEKYEKGLSPIMVIQGTSITLSNSTMSMIPNQDFQLTATIMPSEDQKINWASENESIVKVSDVGVVTALSVGNTKVNASIANSSTVGSVDIKVIDKATVVLTPTQEEIALNGTLQFQATLSPDDLVDKEIAWTSSDEKIATVDANGLVTGLKSGTASITASAAGGSASGMIEVGKVITSLGDNAINGVGIYPNPTNSILHVRGLSKSAYTVEIYSTSGQLYATETLNENRTIDIRTVPKGLYHVIIKNDTESTVFLVVKN